MSKDFDYPKFKKELMRELRKMSVNKLRCPLGKNITFDQIKLIDRKITDLSKKDKLLLELLEVNLKRDIQGIEYPATTYLPLGVGCFALINQSIALALFCFLVFAALNDKRQLYLVKLIYARLEKKKLTLEK